MTESGSGKTESHRRYAEVLEKCQDMAVIFSNSQLAEVFEHAGTAFLDFAERAENNSMQSRFFEAMGLIQRRRDDMEHIFREEINRGFQDFRELQTAAPGVDSEEVNGEETELSLVEQDDMEESVAAENLIVKANASFFPELYALSQRLTVVNGGKKLKDYEIPASPHHLVNAYRRSMKGLEIGVRIKVILYALFDKFVIAQAKGLYDELNGHLKDAGILPNLKPVHIRPGQAPEQPASEAQQQEQEDAAADQGAGADPDYGGQQPASLGAELFGSIVEMMSRRHGSRYGGARRRAAPQTAAERASAAAASRDLVSAIGKVQLATTPEAVHSMVDEAAAIPNLQVDTVFVERVKETLSQEREQVLSKIDREKLSPMDADLIDLIGMLFEYMLNDPVLPNLAKALLSHLHTPYLKVALIDRRLLVDAGHPSRELLDKMVEAGSLWIDESNPKSGIFPAMQQVVDRVLQEFSEDISLFEDLLAFFEKSVKEQRRKTDTTEQRTQEAARGREKLHLAKQHAKGQIRTLLQRIPLPAPVSGFLNKTWLDQLVFILLRNEDADESDAWKQANKTAEELVSLFEPKGGTAMLDANPGMIADLRKRITSDLKRMGTYTHSAVDTLFEFLDAPETWQESCAKAATAQAEKPGAEKEPEAASPEEKILADQEAASDQEQEIIERLRKMKFGTWFEFVSETGGVPRRIKLSWLSPLTFTCMFVDRSGMQAEIKTLRELAQEILSGRAKVIPRPKHPFIERALVSIRTMLQGDEESSPAGDAAQQQ